MLKNIKYLFVGIMIKKGVIIFAENVCIFKKDSYLCTAFKRKCFRSGSLGEVAEWSIAAVLKTVVPRGTRGSNPCLSAGKGCKSASCVIYTLFTPNNVKLGVFALFKSRYLCSEGDLIKTKQTKRIIKSFTLRLLLYKFNCLTAAMHQSNMCFGMDTRLIIPKNRLSAIHLSIWKS